MTISEVVTLCSHVSARQWHSDANTSISRKLPAAWQTLIWMSFLTQSYFKSILIWWRGVKYLQLILDRRPSAGQTEGLSNGWRCGHEKKTKPCCAGSFRTAAHCDWVSTPGTGHCNCVCVWFEGTGDCGQGQSRGRLAPGWRHPLTHTQFQCSNTTLMYSQWQKSIPVVLVFATLSRFQQVGSWFHRGQDTNFPTSAITTITML